MASERFSKRKAVEECMAAHDIVLKGTTPLLPHDEIQDTVFVKSDNPALTDQDNQTKTNKRLTLIQRIARLKNQPENITHQVAEIFKEDQERVLSR